MRPRPTPGPGQPSVLERFFATELMAWTGKAPLSRVFWLHGVVFSSVLILLYATTLLLGQPLAEQALVLVCGAYTFWILVSIWRCSFSDDTFWGLLARYLTIAWAANAAMVLAFRQLELLIYFSGAVVP